MYKKVKGEEALPGTRKIAKKFVGLPTVFTYNNGLSYS